MAGAFTRIDMLVMGCLHRLCGLHLAYGLRLSTTVQVTLKKCLLKFINVLFYLCRSLLFTQYIMFD